MPISQPIGIEHGSRSGDLHDDMIERNFVVHRRTSPELAVFADHAGLYRTTVHKFYDAGYDTAVRKVHSLKMRVRFPDYEPLGNLRKGKVRLDLLEDRTLKSGQQLIVEMHGAAPVKVGAKSTLGADRYPGKIGDNAAYATITCSSA